MAIPQQLSTAKNRNFRHVYREGVKTRARSTLRSQCNGARVRETPPLLSGPLQTGSMEAANVCQGRASLSLHSKQRRHFAGRRRFAVGAFTFGKRRSFRHTWEAARLAQTPGRRRSRFPNVLRIKRACARAAAARDRHSLSIEACASLR